MVARLKKVSLILKPGDRYTSCICNVSTPVPSRNNRDRIDLQQQLGLRQASRCTIVCVGKFDTKTCVEFR